MKRTFKSGVLSIVILVSGGVGCSDPAPVAAPVTPQPVAIGAADGRRVWFYEAGGMHVIYCEADSGCVKLQPR